MRHSTADNNTKSETDRAQLLYRAVELYILTIITVTIITTTYITLTVIQFPDIFTDSLVTQITVATTSSYAAIALVFGIIIYRLQ